MDQGIPVDQSIVALIFRISNKGEFQILNQDKVMYKDYQIYIKASNSFVSGGIESFVI